MENQSSNHEFNVNVKPGKTKEVGRVQMKGRSFVSGERYSLRGNGYPLPIEGTVP